MTWAIYIFPLLYHPPPPSSDEVEEGRQLSCLPFALSFTHTHTRQDSCPSPTNRHSPDCWVNTYPFSSLSQNVNDLLHPWTPSYPQTASTHHTHPFLDLAWWWYIFMTPPHTPTLCVSKKWADCCLCVCVKGGQTAVSASKRYFDGRLCVCERLGRLLAGCLSVK